MNRIYVREVELEGFGLYRDKTRFDFAPGLNVLIAPNETGKSTFMNGLLATLFGLPEKSDAESWGTTRYRNWESPLHFKGRISLHTSLAWHQIKRDFATHAVQWSTMALTDPESPLASKGSASKGESLTTNPGLTPLALPTKKDWQLRFDEEHNPAGRGEQVRRYQDYLHELLGIEDRELFLLTYCLTQDPEDRPADEIDFRTRKVPDSVQGLISGSGGQIDEVLTHLYESFGDISMGTADAGLIRPGKHQARNLRKDGRLEEVTKKLKELRGQMAGAEINLEDLQNTQERLEIIRREEEECLSTLTEDRQLMTAWDEWSRARKEQRVLLKQIDTISRALSELENQQTSHRDKERELAEQYAEYLASGFPFADKEKELTALIEQERDAQQNRQTLDEALDVRRTVETQLAKKKQVIADELAPFETNPGLLRDYDRWQEIHFDTVKLETGLGELAAAEARQKEIIKRYQRWSRLVDDEAGAGEVGPGAKLVQMRRTIPTWLGHLKEAEQLTSELADLESALSGELAPAGMVSEAGRQEAEAYRDRHQLYRIEADKSAQRTADLQNKRDQLISLEAQTSELAEGIESKLSGTEFAKDAASAEAEEQDQRAISDDEAPAEALAGNQGLLTPTWQQARQLLQKKDQSEREQAALSQRIEEAQARIRTSWWRKRGLPAAIAMILIGAGGAAAGLIMDLSLLYSVGGGLVMGLLAAVVTILILSRQRLDGEEREQRSAKGRLTAVRRTLKGVNQKLLDLSDLDTEQVDDLLEKLRDYERLAADLAPLQAIAPTEAEVTQTDQQANQARADLLAFEERMRSLGDKPHELVTRWQEADRRAGEIRNQLEELSEQIGTLDWAECQLDHLPESWADMMRLGDVIFDLVPTARLEQAPREPGNSHLAPSTGADLARILSQIDDEMWDGWIAEAKSLEEAARELAETTIRRQTLEAGGPDRQSRLDHLLAQEKKLATKCAPFTLESPRGEVADANEVYQRIRREREQHQTSLTGLLEKIPELEEKVASSKSLSDGKRDTLRGLLQPAGGDPAAALERLRRAKQLRFESEKELDAIGQVIQSHDSDSIEGLQIKLTGVREEWRQVSSTISAHDEKFVQLRELAEADADEIQRQHSDLRGRIESNEKQVTTLREKRESVQKRASDARAEGDRVGNAAILELEIAELADEEARLYAERDALEIAFKTVREAEKQFSKTYRERMEERARTIFQEISLKSNRSVQIDEQFQIQIVEQGGQPCVLRQLSQGARDQLAIALRLAVADLLADVGRPPLILDDPFLAFDPERLEAVRSSLGRLAADRQVILLSHRPEMSDWGYAVTPV